MTKKPHEFHKRWVTAVHGCESKETILISRELTIGKDRDVPTLSKDSCREDTKDQEDGTRSGPPANKVTNKVYLLVTLVLSPKANTLLSERPRAGRAGVWMGSGQSSVMSKHQVLQLNELGEEVHRLGLAVLLISKPFIEFIKVYERQSAPVQRAMDDHHVRSPATIASPTQISEPSGSGWR